VDLLPALAPRRGRQAVEVTGQPAEAFVPAGRVARRLTYVIEGVGERQQGSRAVLAKLDPQQVRTPWNPA
jgi:hypothetical protein